MHLKQMQVLNIAQIYNQLMLNPNRISKMSLYASRKMEIHE